MEFRPLGKTGVSIPSVGLGTYGFGGGMGRNPSRDEEAVGALRLGLDLGMRLVDTAEMYASGHSEELVAQAIRGREDSPFIASKVSPSHFAYDDVLQSAQNSLRRLGLKRMDLYQLHWPNPKIPIGETMRAMEKLVRDGLVRFIGVSNFSVRQTKEAQQALSHERVVSNQVEYSLLDRSTEAEVLPFCQGHGIALIAYSPLGQGRIPSGGGAPFKVLDEIAEKLGRTRSQVALNWLLKNESVILIPKAIRKEHVMENSKVADWKISPDDYEKISEAFQ